MAQRVFFDSPDWVNKIMCLFTADIIESQRYFAAHTMSENTLTNFSIKCQHENYFVCI